MSTHGADANAMAFYSESTFAGLELNFGRQLEGFELEALVKPFLVISVAFFVDFVVSLGCKIEMIPPCVMTLLKIGTTTSVLGGNVGEGEMAGILGKLRMLCLLDELLALTIPIVTGASNPRNWKLRLL